MESSLQRTQRIEYFSSLFKHTYTLHCYEVVFSSLRYLKPLDYHLSLQSRFLYSSVAPVRLGVTVHCDGPPTDRIDVDLPDGTSLDSSLVIAANKTRMISCWWLPSCLRPIAEFISCQGYWPTYADSNDLVMFA